jgi:uncharacterized repeat protein (TIGR02543 family)
MLTGWKIEGEEGEELTLNSPVTKNITVVAEWAEAPKKPYYTITFSRNAGNGTFEKRFAIPQKRYWKAKEGAEDTTIIEGITEEVNGSPVPIALTDNEEYKAENAAPVYAEFKITDKYPEFMLSEGEDGSTVTQNAGGSIPGFTREHYEIDGTAAWKDLKGNAISNPGSHEFTEDTTLYQQWKAKTYTLTFDANGHGTAPAPAVINNVSEPDSAEGGIKKALNRETMPSIAELVDGKISEVENDNTVEYTFAGWADARQGGNPIGVNTPLYPKNGNTEITLYAQWTSGLPPRMFTYKGIPQEWTVPETGRYQIEAYGAGGGSGKGGTSGYGGYISGEIELTKETKLYVYCGGQGAIWIDGNGNSGDGGWNGGGKSGGDTSGGGRHAGHGGNGATDVRTVGGAWDDEDSLASRIIVAGGDGGAGSEYSVVPGNGGVGIAGGGTVALSNASVSGGGTTEGSGGVASPNTGLIKNPTNGGFGYGGNGGAEGRGGGGGGGGYYGGAGGTLANTSNKRVLGGGGGSSWAKIDGDDLKFENILPASKDGGGTWEYPGKVVITFLGSD